MLILYLAGLAIGKVVIVDDVGLTNEEIQKIKEIRSKPKSSKKIEIHIETDRDNSSKSTNNGHLVPNHDFNDSSDQIGSESNVRRNTSEKNQDRYSSINDSNSKYRGDKADSQPLDSKNTENSHQGRSDEDSRPPNGNNSGQFESSRNSQRGGFSRNQEPMYSHQEHQRNSDSNDHNRNSISREVMGSSDGYPDDKTNNNFLRNKGNYEDNNNHEGRNTAHDNRYHGDLDDGLDRYGDDRDDYVVGRKGNKDSRDSDGSSNRYHGDEIRGRDTDFDARGTPRHDNRRNSGYKLQEKSPRIPYDRDENREMDDSYLQRDKAFESDSKDERKNIHDSESNFESENFPKPQEHTSKRSFRDQNRSKRRYNDNNRGYVESKHWYKEKEPIESDSESSFPSENVQYLKTRRHRKPEKFHSHAHDHHIHHRKHSNNMESDFDSDEHSSSFSVKHYPIKDPRLINHRDRESHVVETAVVPPTDVHPEHREAHQVSDHEPHYDDPHDPYYHFHDSTSINHFHHEDNHHHSDSHPPQTHYVDPKNRTEVVPVTPENLVHSGYPDTHEHPYAHLPITFLHKDIYDPHCLQQNTKSPDINRIIPENIQTNFKDTICPVMEPIKANKDCSIIVLPDLDPKIDLVRLEKSNLMDANKARTQLISIKIRESLDRSESIDKSIKDLQNKFNTLEQTLEQRRITNTSIESTIQILRNKKSSLYKNQNDLKSTKDKISAEYRLLKNNLLHLCKEIDDLKQKAITKEQEQGVYEERIKTHGNDLQNLEKNLVNEESRSLEYKKELDSIQSLMATFQAKITELAARRDREQALQNQLDMERERILRSDLGYAS